VGSFMSDFWRAPSRRAGMRTASLLVVVVGVLALAGASGIASADTGGPGTAIAYGSTWAYTGSAPASGWMNPGFDASSWATDTAPFSDRTPVYCAGPYGEAGLPTTANTDFAVHSTLYLRNTFSLPADAWGLHLTGTIDNNASVWVNGGSYGSASGGSCSTGDINVDVPSASLTRGAASDLVAVQASDSGVATYFALQATYGAIGFGNQPVETQKNSPITDGSGPIRVTITPPAGGAAVPDGTEVDLTLQAISGSGTLSGGTAYTSGGVATFPSLAVSAPGEYRLVATSGGATVTSSAFVIADQVTTCPAGQTCTSTGGSTANTKVTASSSFTSNNQLGVSVIDGGAGIPANVCGGFIPQGAGSFINILGGVVGGGNITATWTLAKSLVMQAGNPGAAHFDICLGAENLQGGTTPWTTKNGSPASPVYDSNLGATLYWGLLPDCPHSGSPTGPCILHRDKNQGNEVVSFYLPYPWDASFHGG
jgi:hypothetical protein